MPSLAPTMSGDCRVVAGGVSSNLLLDPVFLSDPVRTLVFVAYLNSFDPVSFCSIPFGRCKTAARLRPKLEGEIRTTRDRSETTPCVFGHVYFHVFLYLYLACVCKSLQDPRRGAQTQSAHESKQSKTHTETMGDLKKKHKTTAS